MVGKQVRIIGKDVLEVGVCTDKFEVFTFGEDATTCFLEDFLERDTTIYGCTA